MMNHHARRGNEIEDLARQIRTALGIDDQDRPDIIDVLDRLRKLGHIAQWGVREDISQAGACYDLNQRTLHVNKATYEALRHGDARARWAVAHEIGHALLGHIGRSHRRGPGSEIPRATIEREASIFAALFLAPTHLIEKSPATAETLAARFGISRDAARLRWDEFRRRQPAVGVPVDEEAEQKVRRAGQLQFAAIREALERDHFGAYVMINTEVAEYVVGATTSEVHAKFIEKFGESAPGWCTRIGVSVFAAA